MTEKLLDHTWHSDIDYVDLPGWIVNNPKRFNELQHGKELVGRNIRYKMSRGKLMRRLRNSIPVDIVVSNANYRNSGRSIAMSKQLPFNVTKQVSGGSRLSGSRDAKDLHNRYQAEVDNAHAALVNEIHHVESVNRAKALDFYFQAQALREDVKAHSLELDSLDTKLRELLNVELDQQGKVISDNKQGLGINTTEGFRNDVVGILGSVSSTPTLRYLEKYPELLRNPGVKELQDRIEQKIKDVRVKVEAYNRAVSSFNKELPFYDKNVKKCEDNLERYHRVLREGTERISSCRYVNSWLFKLLPESQKMEILLDTLKYPVEKWEHMIETFKGDLSKWQRRPFEELSY